MNFWFCPLCGIEQLLYGKTCEDAHKGICIHQNELNVNGKYYIKNTNTESTSIGIAQISDEEN